MLVLRKEIGNGYIHQNLHCSNADNSVHNTWAFCLEAQGLSDSTQ